MKEPHGKHTNNVETGGIVAKLATVQIAGEVALATQDENLYTIRWKLN